MNTPTALLIIDVQNALFLPEYGLYQGETLLSRLQTLIRQARETDTPVIYVQHTEPEGEFAPEAPTWEIHEAIRPLPSDPIVRKTSWDSFHQTELQQVLEERGIRKLVIAGMQTEFCLDTTVRRAYSLGYTQNVLVQDAHSTFDTEALPAERIIGHHNRTLGGRFARLETTDRVVF
ncbi:cysteine hydrolase family protein [Gorillibacterium sp. sgz5001074]|uniref:cysteine hydrolase family protein n=1 Tax=Gorillibacterium sp. sgz5001074 TaxID=3446695 RepID=UPI003F67D32D